MALQGVTFEELGSVNNLVQKEDLNQDQKDKAVEIVQRLQRAELFSLLENSREGDISFFIFDQLK